MILFSSNNLHIPNVCNIYRHIWLNTTARSLSGRGLTLYSYLIDSTLSDTPAWAKLNTTAQAHCIVNILYRVTLYYNVSYPAISYRTTSYHIIVHCIISSSIMWYIRAYHSTWNHFVLFIELCSITAYLIQSHTVVVYHISCYNVSCCITYRSVSQHIIMFPIVSSHIASCIAPYHESYCIVSYYWISHTVLCLCVICFLYCFISYRVTWCSFIYGRLL